MDSFHKSNTIRLRSHNGKYLYADDDECGVSQSRDTSKRNSIWIVEFDDKDHSKLRLKSCYGCYLTATNVPFLLGWTGNKVLQMKLVDSESSVIWEPIKEGFSVKLRTRGGSFLRANGSIPPWRNSVTHDDSTHKQDWFVWEVVPVGNGLSHEGPLSQSTSFTSTPSFTSNMSFANDVTFEQQSSFPNVILEQQSSFPEVMLEHQASSSSVPSFNEHPIPAPRFGGRIIHYAVADDDHEIPDSFDSDFLFKGDDVKMLTEKMKEETGIEDNLYICAKNHVSNKLFPLLLQLPPNNAPMYVVVVKASSKLAKELPGVGVVEPEQNDTHLYSRQSSWDD